MGTTMRTYIAKRFVQAVPTLLLLTMIAFTFINMAPGDVVDAMIDPSLMEGDTSDVLEQRRKDLGLDQPVPVQYANWLWEVAQGNLGYSFIMHRPVLDMILERLWATVQLGGIAILIAILIGLPTGIISGLKQYSAIDYIVSIFSYGAWSFPSFYLGLICIYIFSVKLDVLPTAGMMTRGEDSLADRVEHLILPSVVLSAQFVGLFARQTRSSVLEVLNEDYVRTAYAKGLRSRYIVVRHVLPNALIPVITVIGVSLPLLITGAIITEVIFSWSGMGSLTVNAITARDYPVVMGIVLVIGCAVIAINLMIDLTYAVVDPRIRLH